MVFFWTSDPPQPPCLGALSATVDRLAWIVLLIMLRAVFIIVSFLFSHVKFRPHIESRQFEH